MKKLISLILFVSMGSMLFGQNKLNDPLIVKNLYGLKIDQNASVVKCRSIPFLVAPTAERGVSQRKFVEGDEIIPVGSKAKTLFLSGMINEGWDYGLAHWGEHPELQEKRQDQIQIGSEIAVVEILYDDNSSDKIPLVIGATAWFFNAWKYGSHETYTGMQEPFRSRPEYMKVLRQSLLIKEDTTTDSQLKNYASFYLAVVLQSKQIKSLIIHDNKDLRGNALISGITLEAASPSKHLVKFGKQIVEAEDIEPAFESFDFPDIKNSLGQLSDILYTSEKDLPDEVELIDFPASMDAAKISFLGENVESAMLSNMWVANLMDIDEKFETESGCFYETGVASPFYGGYQGIGTWESMGIYRQAYSRTSDHYVRQALRCVNDQKRMTSFVDFSDQWLYFYRPNHNPANGPENTKVDTSRYPLDAPPHWAFVMNVPEQMPFQINEIYGDEEMEGHASTMVARWYAWKLLGKPTDGWLGGKRMDVYGKSRYDATKDAADFICWFMDHSGMDVIFSEGEFTGWSAKWLEISQIPEGMAEETDIVKIRKNYANSDMYGVYASYTCMTGLLCSAEMAEAVNDNELAQKYRDYAGRIRMAMLRLLAHGSNHNRMWDVARNSVLPSLQDCLVHTWYSLYMEGLDPKRMDPQMTPISRNTLTRQLNERYGDKPVIAMGYGIGWLTHAALVLDEMDNAGRLLMNIAKYSYDKNMNYYDESRDIDWRKWMWLIPEGSNVMSDGRWYRICDLGNGANQGPAMNALEICAGIDDANTNRLRLLPRIPDPLTGLEVKNMMVMTEENGKTVNIRLNYSYEKGKVFELNADKALKQLDIRFGPYESKEEASELSVRLNNQFEGNARVESSGSYHSTKAWWVWLENLQYVKYLKVDLN